MKALLAVVTLLSVSSAALAIECTLTVKDKNTGKIQPVTLEKISDQLFYADALGFSASYALDHSKKVETLVISNEDAVMASVDFIQGSNSNMVLNVSANKRFATLACESK